MKLHTKKMIVNKSVAAFGLNLSNIFLEFGKNKAITVETIINPHGIIFGNLSSISAKAIS